MLNKPKFMEPSTNKEECTIDLTASKIPFSCIVDGNESINKWQIKIYDITNDEEVFKTKEVTLKSSFYPVDEKNRNVVFSVDLKQYIPENNTTFVNRKEAYYWTITLWGSSGGSTTSYQEVFYANKTPTVNVSYKYPVGEDYIALSKESDKNILRGRGCTFKANLDFGTNTQEYKSPLKRYGWRITDADNGQVLIDTVTKNQIYGSVDNIICNYNGFLNDGNYTIETLIETQNNTKIISSFEFSVSYVTTFAGNDFRVETLNNEPAVMLDWNKPLVFAGILKDAKDNIVSIDDTIFRTDYPIRNHCSIKIPVDHKVIYDNEESLNFDINENAYIAYSTQLLSDSRSNVFISEGYNDAGYAVSRALRYEDGVFYYDVVWQKSDGTEASTRSIYRVKNRPADYVWYNIFMSPFTDTDGVPDSVVGKFMVYESKAVGGIYPSESLYPMSEEAWEEVGSKNFYPIFGTWVKEE